MSMVLPQPTSPYMYNPIGRFSGILVEGGLLAPRPNNEPKKDCFGWRSRDSMLGWTTWGGWYDFKASNKFCKCWIIPETD